MWIWKISPKCLIFPRILTMFHYTDPKKRLVSIHTGNGVRNNRTPMSNKLPSTKLLFGEVSEHSHCFCDTRPRVWWLQITTGWPPYRTHSTTTTKNAGNCSLWCTSSSTVSLAFLWGIAKVLCWYYRAKDRILLSKVSSRKQRTFESKLFPLLNKCLGEPMFVDGLHTTAQDVYENSANKSSSGPMSKQRAPMRRKFTRTKSFGTHKQQESQKM